MPLSDLPSDLRDSAARLLWDTAREHPHAAAVIDGDEVVSYAELRGRAAAFARTMRAWGVAPGDRVAVWLERGADAAAAYFGAVAAGAVAVVVNDVLRPRQVEHVLAHCGASLLVARGELLDCQPRELRGEIPRLDPTEVAAADAGAPLPRAAEEPAQIIYTSGSTGLPKGVVLSHANLRACAAAVSGYLGLRAEDRTASLLPFSSVYGFNQLLCAVATGGALVVERSPLATRIAATLREREVTVAAAVPPLWAQLLRAAEFTARSLPALRILQNAGGHLPTENVRRLRQAQPRARLFLQYGLTEVMRSTFLPPEELDRRPGSVGRAIPGAEVLVLRPDGTPCLPGEVGELVHLGPTVALGYWGDPEASARVFRPHPRAGAQGRAVHSGDLVRCDAEGFLYFVGRGDRMIKTLGYRVGPDEVAEVLLASGQAEEAVVTGEPDPVRGEAGVAHVVLRPAGSLARLEAFCRRELPRHMQPVRFETHAALPRTPAGKYDARTLREAARA